MQVLCGVNSVDYIFHKFVFVDKYWSRAFIFGVCVCVTACLFACLHVLCDKSMLVVEVRSGKFKSGRKGR